MPDTPFADEVERHLVSRDVVAALWDEAPCCDVHMRSEWATGTGWPAHSDPSDEAS